MLAELAVDSNVKPIIPSATVGVKGLLYVVGSVRKKCSSRRWCPLSW